MLVSSVPLENNQHTKVSEGIISTNIKTRKSGTDVFSDFILKYQYLRTKMSVVLEADSMFGALVLSS